MNGKTCCTPAHPHMGAQPIQDPAFVRTSSASTEGMRLIPGGQFEMGNDRNYGFIADGESPVHTVRVAPFWMDETAVTNEQFEEFIQKTRYITEAEKFGWSFVFYGDLTEKRRQQHVRQVVSGSEWWCRVEGATWRHPEGEGSNIKKRWKHPVVHISWNDALSYCNWAGKRLPTEAEWEHAARGGLSEKNRFPWGDELTPGGKHRMNVWQGIFPTKNSEADGYHGTAPAKTYIPNKYGLYNMTGNVWEWCWDWFSTNFYKESPIENPSGPKTGERRVMRGGSYLCHESYCNRYRVDSRSSNTANSSTTNLGFRCVRDI